MLILYMWVVEITLFAFACIDDESIATCGHSITL